MRWLVAFALMSLTVPATAAPTAFHPPAARPLDAASYEALLQRLLDEPFADGRLQQLRMVTDGRRTLACDQLPRARVAALLQQSG